MNTPSLLVQFDPAMWMPTAIFIGGANDEETEKLRQIADKMIEVIKEERK